MLDRGDPAWTFYESSQGLFGGDETLVVALEGERPFDPGVLREVARLTPLFERSPPASLRPTWAAAMLTPAWPNALPTAPMIPGRSS